MLPPIQFLFSQGSGLLSGPGNHQEWIKIVNPIMFQNVTSQKELPVSGQSSDDINKNCLISVIVNDVIPYQMAVAKGKTGSSDFSQWEFIIHENYTHIIENKNKITAKLLCMSAPSRWNSVIINGIPNYSNEQMLSLDRLRRKG